MTIVILRLFIKRPFVGQITVFYPGCPEGDWIGSQNLVCKTFNLFIHKICG